MEPIHALQHQSCNVERGYFPHRGAGFQTVAVSEALLESPDLPVLQDMASYYEVSADRRRAGDLPQRDCLFLLPSGRAALGRTRDWGAGPSGRRGNYLSYQLVLPADSIHREHWDPLALLDAVTPDQSEDLAPRALADLPVTLQTTPPPPLPEFPADLLGSLIQDLITAREPVLLIAPECVSSRLISALYFALPRDERSRLTFCTHFYRNCHHLAASFRLVSVATIAEAPVERSAYRLYDLVAGVSDARRPAGPTAQWLAAALRAGNAQELNEVRRVVDGLRSGAPLEGLACPGSNAALAAVWDRVGSRAAYLLPTDAGRLTELLEGGAFRQEMADALLERVSPDDLGTEATVVLQRAASGAAWSAWVRKWRAHPAVSSLARPKWAFWLR